MTDLLPGEPPAVLAHQLGSAAFYWALVAELFLLFWTAALLLAPRWGASDIAARRFRLVGLGAALVAALLTMAGKTLEVWPGNPLFPSGHTAYAVTIAIFLVGRDRRWLVWTLPLLGLDGTALVLSHYHVPVDIAGGALVGSATGLAGFAWLKRSASRRLAVP